MLYKTRNSKTFYLAGVLRLAACTTLMAAVAFVSTFAAPQQSGQKTFSTAEEASNALVEALQKRDHPVLLNILGADGKDVLSSGDAVEDKDGREQFIQKYQQMHRLVIEPDGKTILYIGAENWPTPIPLMRKGNDWYFDTPAGKQEILYRRVGRNELAVIQVCRELADAEKEYYPQPHDGNSGNQYAQKLISDLGKHNGLYWNPSPGESESPIGPLMAAAATEGYVADASRKTEPFHGYYFRVLTRQGVNAARAERSYIVDGKMTRGFAFLAYPAEYRVSGVMTFIVDQDGIVYEKDLGRHTAELAKAIKRYGRNATWRKAD